ncbi:MAG: hypothetical protein DHS20C02_20000 [Micavibrio sp.]|nr:MAG: hypothetical protein DHS20C02_20000 [Micavibrio sp.]
MGRSLEDAFEGHAYIKFMIQMTGLHRFAYSEYGYNATWWYMSVIIPLIVLFPFIYDLTQKYGAGMLVFFLIILLPNLSIFPIINLWLLPFTLGIYLSQRNYVTPISTYLGTYGVFRYIILTTAIAFVVALKEYIPTQIDWLFGSLICLFIFELTASFKAIDKTLGFLGKHLFNIFLFHTFIYYYYWEDFIYSFKNPILIFLVLLAISILISLLLEELKKGISVMSAKLRIAIESK